MVPHRGIADLPRCIVMPTTGVVCHYTSQLMPPPHHTNPSPRRPGEEPAPPSLSPQAVLRQTLVPWDIPETAERPAHPGCGHSCADRCRYGAWHGMACAWHSVPCHGAPMAGAAGRPITSNQTQCNKVNQQKKPLPREVCWPRWQLYHPPSCPWPS